MSYHVEDFEAIRRRQEEIKAERDLLLTGSAIPTAEKVGEAAVNWAYASTDVDYCY